MNRLTFGLLLLLLFSCQVTSAQDVAQGDTTVSIVDRVRDAALAYPPADFPFVEYRLVLRFLPTWDLESQIVISQWREGPLEVDRYSLEDKRANISQIADEEYLRGIDDPRTIAQKIRIQKTAITTPPQGLKDLLASFFQLRLSPDLKRDPVLDVTRYELRLETASNTLYYRLKDSDEDHNTHVYPLVNWMLQVKKVVFSEGSK